jgi:hypothetical protein
VPIRSDNVPQRNEKRPKAIQLRKLANEISDRLQPNSSCRGMRKTPELNIVPMPIMMIRKAADKTIHP